MSVVMVRVRSGRCGEDGDMTVVHQQIVLCCSDDGVKVRANSRGYEQLQP